MDPRPEVTDGLLLRALERGQPEALSTLVVRHQEVLLRHARALLGPAGPFEDAVQETFLRLVARPPRLEADAERDPQAHSAQLRAWLHTVLRNFCMDTLRSEERRRTHATAAAESSPAPRSHAGGADWVEQNDTRAAVERELAKLPTDQREVLVLRLVGERSYKEIAEITGRKIGTVGWLVSEGLKVLADRLAPLVEGARRVSPGAVREGRP